MGRDVGQQGIVTAKSEAGLLGNNMFQQSRDIYPVETPFFFFTNQIYLKVAPKTSVDH